MYLQQQSIASGYRLIISSTDNNEHADVVNKFQRQTNPRIPNETNELDKVVVGMLIRNTTLTLDCEPSLGHRRVCRWAGGGGYRIPRDLEVAPFVFYDNTGIHRNKFFY